MNSVNDFIASISLPEEVWRPIYGFNNKYVVSNLGRIAMLPTIVSRNGKPYPFRGRLKALKLAGKATHQYYYVRFTEGHQSGKYYPVHRLVANAFIPNPEHKPCVDHIDGNQLNNSAENLHWVTYEENSYNPITRAKQRFKQCVKTVQLLEDTVIKIYDSVTDAVKDGYSQCRINLCFKNSKMTHKGFHWIKYSDYINTIQ